MYNIGSIPAVLRIKIATNQANWLFLPAFHKAMPFQAKVQIIARAMINGFNSGKSTVIFKNWVIIL